MATTGQNYAVGIGTGAAGGAAAGSAFGPWGTLIGAGVGAVGGGISAGMANAKEAAEKRKLLAAQQRSKQAILTDIYEKMAQRGGMDTTYLDTLRAEKGEQIQDAAQNAQFAAQHRIDPNSFVAMAQLGTQAAGRTYNSINQPDPNAARYPMFSLPNAEPGTDSAPSYAGGDAAPQQLLPQGAYPRGVNPNEEQDWLRSVV